MKKSLAFLCCSLLLACGDPATPAKNDSAKKDTVKMHPSRLPDSVPQKFGTADAAQADTAFREFAFVVENRYIVLTAKPDTNWVAGKPHAPAESKHRGVYFTFADVKTDLLPAAYAELQGNSFWVCSDSGAYKASVSGFKLYAASIPHFGEVQRWSGSDGEKKAADADEQMAWSIWRSGAVLLVAEFTTDPKEKISGLLGFAVPAKNPAPALYARSEEDTSKIRKDAAQLMQATPESKVLQQDFKKAFPSLTGSWWDHESYESFVYFTRGTEGIAVMNHTCGSPCGSEFFAEKTGAFSLKKAGAPLLTMLFMQGGFSRVMIAADINGDNTPELLVDDGFGNYAWISRVNGVWEKRFHLSIPYFDCPC